MDMSVNRNMMDFIPMFLFIILPLILILAGAISGFMNAVFYILTMTWFGMGIIFYKAIY